MLTEREILILKYLSENQNRFVTSKELAERLNVSVRTIKSDIKNLKFYFEDELTIAVKTIRSKGITLECTDFDRFYRVIEDNIEKNKLSLNSQNNRINQLLLEIFNDRLSKIDIQHRFNISESTVNNDLSDIKVILSQFNLKLIINENKKLSIIGKEQHKRQLMGQYKNINNLTTENNFFSIENVILKILIEEEYMVTEKIFNNILIHIQISVDRIKVGEPVTEYNKLSNKWNRELNIAQRIFKELSRIFDFDIFEGEIINLAILLIGKSDFDDQNYISDKISHFINSVLSEIDKTFNVKFMNQFENKLNLSLHLVPLLERLKHNVQLHSQHTDFIQQSFPLAFDISAFFSLKIQEDFGVLVTKDEIAYLAIHLNKFLIESNENWGKKEVLIISNIRRSESILLKQRLLTWFREEISNVEVLNYSEVSKVDVDKFDILFTTKDDKFTSQYAPILISKFPRDNDYLNLKLAIDGFQGKEDILSLFKKDLFHIDKIETKEEVFDKFSEVIIPYVGEHSAQFMESVKTREKMSNTYFSNRIAFPHPAVPFSIESFVSVILLKKPLVWNEDLDKVKIVMLVAIEKNNAKSFQLWNYLSGLTKDEMFSSRINNVNSYKEFIDAMKLSIEYTN